MGRREMADQVHAGRQSFLLLVKDSRAKRP